MLVDIYYVLLIAHCQLLIDNRTLPIDKERSKFSVTITIF